MRGFSIVELLIAMSITLVITAASLSLVGPLSDLFQVQPETADEQQRVRVGIDVLHRDLLIAGAGMYAAGSVGPLHMAIAPVMPYRAFSDSSDSARGVYFRRDAISLLFVPSTPSQTTLSAPLEPGLPALALENAATCPRAGASQVCGFEAGDHLLVFDRAGSWAVFAVDRLDADGSVALRGAVPAPGFDAGSNVTEVASVTYALKEDPVSGAYQLVRSDGLGPAQPVLDNVVKLELRYFGEAGPPQIVNGAGDDDRRATYGPSPPRDGDRVTGWPPGENCTFALIDGRHQTRLESIGPANTLVEMDSRQLTDGPWCPDAESGNRFDADLLRIRRVRFTLRVQTAVAALRGPAGPLFARSGSARAASRFVPDFEIGLDVTPRNMSLAR